MDYIQQKEELTEYQRHQTLQKPNPTSTSKAVEEPHRQGVVDARTPQELKSWKARLLRASLDAGLALIACLFLVYAFFAYRNHEQPFEPGSEAAAIINVSQYGPTVFPIVFAAIVGGTSKSMSTWRLQRGTRIGIAEQLLGSDTLFKAFTTQIFVRAFNPLGLAIILLWCLSPIGGQASLRVVSTVPAYYSQPFNMNAVDTFAEWIYQFGAVVVQIPKEVQPPFLAAFSSAKVLSTQNRDLWGNIRVPAIEQLIDDDNMDWVTISDPVSVDYPSLVGVPVGPLPASGNSSFTLSSSYLNIDCPEFVGIEDGGGADYVNYTALKVDAPASGPQIHCKWTMFESINAFNLAVADYCDGFEPDFNTTPPVRRMVYESDAIGTTGFTRAKCDLTTTYVDVNMTCSGPICSPVGVRRSPIPVRNPNWTVFDLASGRNMRYILDFLYQQFDGSTVHGDQNPLANYIVDPYNPTDTITIPAWNISKADFELHLGQLVNTVSILGAFPKDVTRRNISQILDTTNYDASDQSVSNITAFTHTQRELVVCNKIWLIILITISWIVLGVGIAGAVVRFYTLVPDILGTLSPAMLDNRCHGATGVSTWAGDERAKKMKEVKICLGDINPHGVIGTIGFAAPVEDVAIIRVRNERKYL